MCPMCITTTMVMVAGTATGGGVLGFVACKWRALRNRRQKQEVV